MEFEEEEARGWGERGGCFFFHFFFFRLVYGKEKKKKYLLFEKEIKNVQRERERSGK